MSVFCGRCGVEYANNNQYLTSVCSVLGVVPTDPETMGKKWDNISKLALDRGASDSTPEKVKKAKDDIDKLKADKDKADKLIN